MLDRLIKAGVRFDFNYTGPNERIEPCGANSYGPRMVALIGLLAIMLAIAALAASPSETLQKAIYTEETVGTDEAIKLYELVIAGGKAARNAAQQAQYRLALIYLKRGKKRPRPTRLSEKLIKEYPEENDLVAKVRGRLPGEIKFDSAVERSRKAAIGNEKTGDGRDIGTYIDSATHDGRDAWALPTRSYSPLSGSGYSTVLVEKESRADHQPMAASGARRRASNLQAAVRRAENLLKNTTRRGTWRARNSTTKNFAELMRWLPLAVSMTTLPIMSMLWRRAAGG